MTDRELLQQALDALEKISMGGSPDWANDVIPVIRTRLAQPEPEPEHVATIGNWGRVMWEEGVYPQFKDKLYTAPLKKEWVWLTDEERLALFSDLECDLECLKPAQYARAIEAKLKEKNT